MLEVKFLNRVGFQNFDLGSAFLTVQEMLEKREIPLVNQTTRQNSGTLIIRNFLIHEGKATFLDYIQGGW